MVRQVIPDYKIVIVGEGTGGSQGCRRHRAERRHRGWATGAKLSRGVEDAGGQAARRKAADVTGGGGISRRKARDGRGEAPRRRPERETEGAEEEGRGRLRALQGRKREGAVASAERLSRGQRRVGGGRARGKERLRWRRGATERKIRGG